MGYTKFLYKQNKSKPFLKANIIKKKKNNHKFPIASTFNQK